MTINWFSWVHILALLIPIGSTIGLYFLLRRRASWVQDIVILGIMLLNVFQHLFKFVVWPHMRDESFGLVETAYNMCAFLILASPILYLLKGAWRDFLTYVGTAAGFLALLLPVWHIGNQPSWDWLRFCTCHFLLLITSILPVLLGRHKLSFRHFWKMGLCFLVAVSFVFLDQLVVRSIMTKTEDIGEIYRAMYEANNIWMMHPPTDGFVWVVDIIAVFTPKMFLNGEHAAPILWYALPLWLGITIAAFFVGWLVDKEGANAFFARVKALFDKIKAFFAPKTQEK